MIISKVNENSPPHGWLRLDRLASYVVLLALTLVAIWLVLDSTPPNPDFYVYARQSNDMSRGVQTAEKFPPGYPLLIMPATGLSIQTQEYLASGIGLVALILFGFSLIGIARATELPIATFLISAVLANRYVLPEVVHGNSHLPFYAAAAGCLWAVLAKRWPIAFAIAALALLLRYNGVVLPFLVAISCVLAAEPGNRLRRAIFSTLAIVACLAPLALWMKFGSSAGVGSYVEEIAARGQAGIGALRYLAATMLASFLDSDGSERVAGLDRFTMMIVVVVLMSWMWLGAKGLRTVAKSRILAIWVVASLCWWAFVHMRFPDVGGHYLYSMQVVWLLWLLVAAGFSTTNTLHTIAFISPILLLAMNSALTATISLISCAIAAVLVGVRLRSVRTGAVAGLCASLIVVGVITAKQKVFDLNYRPAVSSFLGWAENNGKVLVTPMFYEVLKLEGRNLHSLVSEEMVDGSNIDASLQSLNIRYVAIGTWEFAERDREKTLQSHEFFLGQRYKTSLRPYALMSAVFDEVGWRQIGSFRNRNSEIRIYERVER